MPSFKLRLQNHSEIYEYLGDCDLALRSKDLCHWVAGRWGGSTAKLGVAAPLAGEAHNTCTLASVSGFHSFAGGVWLVARFGLELSGGKASSSSLIGAGLERNRGETTSFGRPKDTLPSPAGDRCRGDPRGESLRL